MNDPNELNRKKGTKVSRFTDSTTRVISTYVLKHENGEYIYTGQTIQSFALTWGQHVKEGRYWPRKKRKWKKKIRGVLGKELDVTATAYEAALIHLNLLKTVVSKNKKVRNFQKNNIDKIITKFKKFNGSTSDNSPK